MKPIALKKSSFTLPSEEINLVLKLKDQLGLKSNTAVIRKALYELQSRIDNTLLRHQFKKASRLVCSKNSEEMEKLDHLSNEGLE